MPTGYTVVVSNNGPSTAVGAAVHDVMPAELTLGRMDRRDLAGLERRRLLWHR